MSDFCDQLTEFSNAVYEYCGRNHRKEIYASHLCIKLRENGILFNKDVSLPFKDEKDNCLGYYSYDFVIDSDKKEVIVVDTIDNPLEIMKQVELLANRIRNIHYDTCYLINFQSSLSEHSKNVKVWKISNENIPEDHCLDLTSL